MKIDLINYNVNNIVAVAKLFSKLNFNVNLVEEVSDFNSLADLIVLPGVGNWQSGRTSLIDSGIFASLQEKNVRGFKILGICLGFQLLGLDSEEATGNGLKAINSGVKSISHLRSTDKKVNSGWHLCESNLRDSVKKYYFTHSFGFDKEKLLERNTPEYISWIPGTRITASYLCNNIFGIQFHPEKSHDQGVDFINKKLKEWI